MLPQTILLSRYKIIKKIGSGGFADTYLAQDIALPSHPFCVVKHLKPKDITPAVFSVAKRLFEREAEILYRLGETDQIPRLYAHFEENGEFYLVEEFIEGDDLSHEITFGKKISEVQTVKLIKDLLEILAVVHRENVIHRDIKPANIIRRKKDNKLVLIDFGAVKEIGYLTIDSHGETGITVAIGSPGYMPSEQANGKPKLASDIYAVGMIAIQALTGKNIRDFPEDINGEIVWQAQTSVNDQLATFIKKMVNYDFRQRYPNAAEALQDLIKNVVSSDVGDETIPLMPETIVLPKSNSFPPWLMVGALGIAGLTSLAILSKLSGNLLLNPSPQGTNTATPVATDTTTTAPTPTPNPVPAPSAEQFSPLQPSLPSSPVTIWRSQSGKTVVPNLESICWGHTLIVPVQTVFASPPYIGRLNFDNPKNNGCVVGDIITGQFSLKSLRKKTCDGTITVTWQEDKNAEIQWDIENNPACPIITKHWKINTFPEQHR